MCSNGLLCTALLHVTPRFRTTCRYDGISELLAEYGVEICCKTALGSAPLRAERRATSRGALASLETVTGAPLPGGPGAPLAAALKDGQVLCRAANAIRRVTRAVFYLPACPVGGAVLTPGSR